MKVKVVFDNGAWFVGERGWRETQDECKGFHHFKVRGASDEFKATVGFEIAIETCKPSYFILNFKD